MNQFLQNYIEQINVLADQLEKTLTSYGTQLASSRIKNEEDQKEKWMMARKIKTMEENLDNLAELKQENEELRQKNMQAAEHAKRILILTKSLADALRL
ncbi:MAG TPA: hypothetical protein PLZ53_09035 [Candidatus Hydrogenedentes bacterium]|nr:MAG: hypothetical protein BWY07_00381 [Candidatus Hydrogenedentes bacterium ADurb.Bin170]HNZ47343.1 hypothetical protein [Candidatus Hydrogenedentota bacterium]HOD94088.1 hypothetical protein [Candidatus Hydrogenedentota bacterium]HOH43252.1 hypothetical protein [Candidatus Hydrogenedentota bacterium]HOM46903.1 hypothetical protein [Candidatus Hydrogenedentota bacterium]